MQKNCIGVLNTDFKCCVVLFSFPLLSLPDMYTAYPHKRNMGKIFYFSPIFVFSNLPLPGHAFVDQGGTVFGEEGELAGVGFLQ
jgi:hypothetical protein